MKAGTRILFSNATTREHAGNREPFWGSIKDTLIRNGHTIYLTEYLQPSKYGDQSTLTTVRPHQIEMIED